MNFEQARPEYYEGLKVFQQRTNQQERLKALLCAFFSQLKRELNQVGFGEAYLPGLWRGALKWKDMGCGDGSFTQKLLEALAEAGIPSPSYEGIDIDPYFVKEARALFDEQPHVYITQGSCLDGNLHKSGRSDMISGFNMLYFAKDFGALKEDLELALNPQGFALFIHNARFTQKAGQALIGEDYKDYLATVLTEVFFPVIPSRAYELITAQASFADIQKEPSLSEAEKTGAIITKKIMESMGGISTETPEGQQVAQTYERRILGEDYGGAGRYVTENQLLVYVPLGATPKAREAVKTALRQTKG